MRRPEQSKPAFPAAQADAWVPRGSPPVTRAASASARAVSGVAVLDPPARRLGWRGEERNPSVRKRFPESANFGAATRVRDEAIAT
ncbi:hypothetical protein E2562_007497 [Oryza meyeriana var. granulata]|uniref:Uncharacterized protein n=1 Tax=Oryza meyeriana var. granulata TaxID=110450 RepID=A0A6G1DVE8_9ORYZ|nr:hypothetical protein E2562_007497 [Oryza meyeriana var. granulata]